MSTPSCPFCTPLPDSVFHDSPLAIGLWDQFPVSPGHALLIPRRHVATWFDATREEHLALLDGIDVARKLIDAKHHPAGYNIGVNIGREAGQTVFHLHVHVIPRYDGDVPDPTGGVRHVIPRKANYLKRSGGNDASSVHDRSLIRGGDDPLLPHLAHHLARATRVDIAVAFVLESGVREILPHLQDLLDRGGRLRLLTGDYLDVTDPGALRKLLDLASGAPDRVVLRAFETSGTSFHPKTYILHRDDGGGIAFVGSSNLSRTALTSGIEWNYRAVSSREDNGFADVVDGFEFLFHDPAVVPLSIEWIECYEARRRPRPVEVERAEFVPPPPPTPNIIQQRALAALEDTRRLGNKAGLVVLATGLGKTWLSAFDSDRDEFRRVLFVAHRDEILRQSLRTFRQIRPGARLGLYSGQEKDGQADVVFASVQTLSRANHLQLFRRDEFDYIIIDEFHHAEARTYRRLIEHFEPKFLLGLTATPERTDGGDLLALCGENRVFRCDLDEGIGLELLCPFHYFGVPDHVDYRNIPWRSGRFDPHALETAMATEARTENALEQHRLRAGRRTLAFCCSVRHADYMAEFFRKNRLRAAAVHAGPTSAPRTESLQRLASNDLDILCVVDMFNEGLDVPEIDTVMMLRPTESRILWLQQIGRGLRRAAGKPFLTIIDYIGNHRSFLIKPEALFGLGSAPAKVRQHLDKLEAGNLELPAGCEVTYDLEAIEILRSLLQPTTGSRAIEAAYDAFLERNGTRPRAAELHHEGYRLGALRQHHTSWLAFVEAKDGLTDSESKVFAHSRIFLEHLEKTQMTRSYKMLVLQALLDRDQFPGNLALPDLRAAVRSIATRSARLAADIGPALTNDDDLDDLLVRNPIAAWTGGRGTGNEKFFAYESSHFRTTSDVPPDLREPLRELTREILELRLAEYLLRGQSEEIRIRVNHNASGPILMPLDRERYPEIPTGETTVIVDGKEYLFDFRKIAVNVARERPDGPNVLSEILRGWFGSEEGSSGRDHWTVLAITSGGYRLEQLQ